MKHTKFTPLESQFLLLRSKYNLCLDDLAYVFGMSQAKVRQVMRRVERKDTLCCERLLRAVFPDQLISLQAGRGRK
jgi:hypothetical protein